MDHGRSADRPLYDRIGEGYATTRRPDPRIAAAIEQALGNSRSVLNVGAGTGNYEPAGRDVTAVEPSAAMIAQRPRGAAPCLQASAEQLPFADRSFDAVMALMTVHHWSDLGAGLAEMRRVAHSRIVIFTWDGLPASASWLAREYLPELGELDLFRFPSPTALAAALDTEDVRPIPIPRDCHDGFIEAFWARPEAYLDRAVRAGMSGMRALAPEVLQRGMARLRADLESGEWDRRHGDLRERQELDMGYRLVVSKLGPLTQGPSAAP